MPVKPPGRYWVIRHPASGSPKQTVAKFDSDTDGEIIPDDVAEYDNFQIQEVSGRSALLDESIDQSGLSDEEKGLLSQIYPVRY